MALKKYIYESCSILLSAGQIKEFKELTNYIPVSSLSKVIGIGYKRGKKVFGNDVGDLSIREIQKAAKVLGVDFDVVFQIVFRQFEKESEEKEKASQK